jgi:uncharacterized membrane protein (DUF373 family)
MQSLTALVVIISIILVLTYFIFFLLRLVVNKKRLGEKVNIKEKVGLFFAIIIFVEVIIGILSAFSPETTTSIRKFSGLIYFVTLWQTWKL